MVAGPVLHLADGDPAVRGEMRRNGSAGNARADDDDVGIKEFRDQLFTQRDLLLQFGIARCIGTAQRCFCSSVPNDSSEAAMMPSPCGLKLW